MRTLRDFVSESINIEEAFLLKPKLRSAIKAVVAKYNKLPAGGRASDQLRKWVHDIAKQFSVPYDKAVEYAFALASPQYEGKEENYDSFKEFVSEANSGKKIEALVKTLKILAYGDMLIIRVLDALGNNINPDKKQLHTAMKKAGVKDKDISVATTAALK